ncbi:hypothetical protein GCM10009676_23720 [Prauserella halophila]|uniref:Uncharacterized protein n=1 Tax=Prauserella halophila TaxID=185641 RepID=A0ABN1W9S8_9PSEU
MPPGASRNSITVAASRAGTGSSGGFPAHSGVPSPGVPASSGFPESADPAPSLKPGTALLGT